MLLKQLLVLSLDTLRHRLGHTNRSVWTAVCYSGPPASKTGPGSCPGGLFRETEFGSPVCLLWAPIVPPLRVRREVERVSENKLWI